MNILHLKYAVEIDKTGSINKAAENLYVGQPNLSRAIKELESSLGITIFKRSAKGMVATADGEEFLNYAKKILAQIDEVEAIYQTGAPLKNKFSISVPRASYISEAFARFSDTVKDYGRFELVYKETNALRAIKNITESDYCLGIIRYAQSYSDHFEEMLEDKGLTYEMITEFNYRIVMSESHPLAQRNDIKYSDLKPYIEITHADPYVPSLPLSVVKRDELPCDVEKRIYVFERASQFELLSENNSTFMFISPAPDRLLKRYGLVQRKCSENNRVYKDMLIYRKDYHLSTLDNTFITELCNTKRKYFN